MHFYLRKIKNPYRAKLQILLLILNAACSSSRSQTEIEPINSIVQSTLPKSEGIFNSTFPEMISSKQQENEDQSAKGLEDRPFSNIPNNRIVDFNLYEFPENRSTFSGSHFKGENDSYEIDIDDNVTMGHVALHDEKHVFERVETDTEIEKSIHLHSLQRIPMEERSVGTKNSLSVFLLSKDDVSSDRNDKKLEDKSALLSTIRIRKRLVDEQQHQLHHRQQLEHEQQQQQRISLHNNKRSRLSESPNSRTTNFKAIILSLAEIKATMPSTPTVIDQQHKNDERQKVISNATVASTFSGKNESKNISSQVQMADSPMVNFIFDTFSSINKHHHHDQRYGPHFEDAERVAQPLNMTVQAGSSIHLNCRVSLLQDKTVSWVRRSSSGGNALDLLTVGPHTYAGDKRYNLEFQYPNNWRLKITSVKKADEAIYECQISTHPPRVIQINLLVITPKVMIVDEYGDPLAEKYYEIDSTLQLSCIVRNVAMVDSVVLWKHGEDVLNHDVKRGGVSVRTELMDDGANSTLAIAKINKSDSGNYTCAISDFQNFTSLVHILNGESFAELHHAGAASMMLGHMLVINLTSFVLLLGFPAVYFSSLNHFYDFGSAQRQ